MLGELKIFSEKEIGRDITNASILNGSLDVGYVPPLQLLGELGTEYA